MGTLANRINNLGTKDRHKDPWSNTETAWLAGFDTGLYEAEMLAKEADKIMQSMAEALHCYSEDDEGASPALDALLKYHKWKECAK